MKRTMDDYFQLERYDVLNKRASDSLHTAINPQTRKDAIQFLLQYKEKNEGKLSMTDKKEIERLISISGEWAPDENGAMESKYPVFNIFYAKKSDFIHVNNYKGTMLVVNPILNYQQMGEMGNTKQNLFINTRGLEARGRLLGKLGFYTMFTDNQERGPLHQQRYITEYNAVPGASFNKPFKESKEGIARDYIIASGYIDAEVLKNTLNVSFGHDRFHLGNGYRSLFLSDFGANYLFLKLNTRLWKFNYLNLFMELTPQHIRKSDRLLPKKYATMHHLSINATRWLNIGLFESVVFHRKDHFDFQYLNPIILYRSIEQANGSPDNVLLGTDFKINTGIGAVLYGQLLLDEFKFSEIRDNKGWWANKYGIQLGAKIADPFGIKNLLIQPEFNMVRPFTYMFRDSVADYTHYNQPLAHPLGANFMEASLQVKYKPTHKIYVTWSSFYNKQGKDTSLTMAFGGNIFKNYEARNANYGINMFNGYATDILFSNLNVSYELAHNLFIDIGGNIRNERSTHAKNATDNSVQAYMGFRLNTARRRYDY
jgi:hypothetical protein